MENLSESVAESTNFAPTAHLASSPTVTLLRKRIAELEAKHARDIKDKNEQIEKLSNYLGDEIMETQKVKGEVENCQEKINELIMSNQLLKARVDMVMEVCSEAISKRDAIRDAEMQEVLKKGLKRCENLVKGLWKKEKKHMGHRVREMVDSKRMNALNRESDVSDDIDLELERLIDERVDARKQLKKEQKEKEEKMKRTASQDMNTYLHLAFLFVILSSIMSMLIISYKKNQQS